MALTGGLAANGRSALLAQKIWEEDTNAKGGLLGRPVKLIYYDDQTNPAAVPGIYAKLLDIDKVDLIIGGYGTNMLAPAMPIAMQRKKVFIGLLGMAVNSTFNYPNYFSMAPNGPDPKPSYTKGFLDLAVRQNPKPQTVAIVAADAEFGLSASEGARENVKAVGLTVVYDRRYPSATTDLAPVVRAIAETNPDLVIVCSYPPDSVGMVRAVNEVDFKPKMIGGAMVGLQSTAIKGSARSATQRLDQLRRLAAGSEDAVRRRRRADEEIPSARGGGRRRCARLLHGTVELCSAPGSPASSRSDREPR
jgi:branched-chain amino acid transport system substrate-binding protein